MTQEEKELLLKDLCARLCYGVKFGIGLGKLGKYDLVEINTKKGKVLFGHGLYTDLETCRPYLRPMSSMTEDESYELSNIIEKWYNKGIAEGRECLISMPNPLGRKADKLTYIRFVENISKLICTELR